MFISSRKSIQAVTGLLQVTSEGVISMNKKKGGNEPAESTQKNYIKLLAENQRLKEANEGLRGVISESIPLKVYNGLPVFWREKDSKVYFNPEDLKAWTKASGFFKSFIDGEYQYIKIENNVIDNTSPALIAEAMKNYIELYYKETPEAPERLQILNCFGEKRKKIENNMTSYTEEYTVDGESVFSPDFTPLWDTNETVYFFFSDRIIAVKKNEIRGIDYKKSDKAIWQRNVLKYNSPGESAAGNESIIKTFLCHCAGDIPERITDLERIAGYLLSRYKPASEPKAVNFYSKDGGTGKSLFVEILSKLRNKTKLRAGDLKRESQFLYGSVTRDTNLIEFPELEQNFKMLPILNDISNDLTIESKHKNSFIIKYDRSPKWIFTRNFAISGMESQNTRRLVEFRFSDYYQTGKREPKKEFGKEFFRPETGWTDQDTEQAFLYLFHCVQQYLNLGLPDTLTEDICLEKIENRYGKEILYFLQDNLKPGTRQTAEQINKKEFYNKFTEETGLKEPKQTTFTKAIEEYCKAMQYTFESCGNGRQSFRILSTETEPAPNNILPFTGKIESTAVSAEINVNITGTLLQDTELEKRTLQFWNECKADNGTPKGKATIDYLLDDYSKADREKAKQIFLDFDKRNPAISDKDTRNIIIQIVSAIRQGIAI